MAYTPFSFGGSAAAGDVASAAPTSGGGYKSFFGLATPVAPSAAQLASERQQNAPVTKPAAVVPTSLFGKITNFAKNDIIKPTVTTGEKALNTVGAGATGLVGLAKASTAVATGNKVAEQNAINNTQAKMDELLSKGNGGVGGYLTPEQAASRDGGTKGLIKNFVKPVAQGVTDIAPLVLPGAGELKGASLLAKVGTSVAKNVAVGAGTTAANEALNGKVTLKDVLKGAAYGGVMGAGGSLLHEGIKTGVDAAKENLSVGNTPEAKALITNQATRSLLDTAHNQPEPPTIKAMLDPQKIADGLIQPEIKETPTSSLVLDAQMAGKKVDGGKVAQYVKQIKDGEPIEPVITHEVNGQTVVIDGQHRLAAAQKLGIDTIPTVEKGSGIPVAKEAISAAEPTGKIGADRSNLKGATAPQSAVEATPEAKPATESQPTVQKTEAPVEPTAKVSSETVAGERGTSKIAQSVQEKAVVRGLKNDFGEAGGYDKITIKDQAAKAVALTNDRPALEKVISGEKPLPDGLRATALIKAVEEHPVLGKDPEIIRRLSQAEHLTGESSRSAQELRLAAERTEHSPIEAMKQVRDARRQAAETKLGKSVDKAINDNVRTAKASVPKVSKETFGSFVESLKC